MILSRYKHKLKQLYLRKKSKAGRNNTGHITVAHQGGGHSQFYRKILFKGNFSKGFVCNFEYDPNRTARIAKICNIKNNVKFFFYILAPQNLKIFDEIENYIPENLPSNYLTVSKQIGSRYSLKELAVGDFVYNIELFPNKGGQLVRAGGSSAVILQKKENFLIIKLPSGEHRKLSNQCKAFLGNLANDTHTKIIWKKAGKSRWLNIRPTVRGVAKNPVDHPHGGNTSGGCHPVTPWARLTKGKPTRSKKKIKKKIKKHPKKKKKKKIMILSFRKSLALENNKKIFNSEKIFIYNRSTRITAGLAGEQVHIYNGTRFFDVSITEKMVGRTFGEFAPTRKFPIHKKKKK